ncbi:non-ribosomal peptide synthetase [Actinopolyspora mortivallis]|uniref:non-ribosomal peptide synthetase n=1 Tax=Actinopolyspora mortivallis TaxID=33906 RepID=UPI00037796F6|nr:non-ribosomal peptide synthetase [Actinopolyspora mortivallis]
MASRFNTFKAVSKLQRQQSHESSDQPTPDLLDRIIRNADQFPDRVVIESDGSHISYRQLMQIAERFRVELAASGVRAGDGVGVHQRRTPELIASLLAVLALGAHFIPLDPKQPRARLRRFMTLSRPRLVMCDPNHQDLGRELGEPMLVSHASPEAGAATLRAERPRADALGYVLFTSGSTGAPKGVEVFRRSMSTLFDSMTDRLGLGSDDIVLAHSTVGFDMSIPELFLPLTLGARMVLATSEQSGSPQKLLPLLRDVTFMQATPTIWKILLALGMDRTDGLTAVTGGESIDMAAVRELLEAVETLWNFYGPTEATVWVSCQQLSPNTSYAPLGDPFADTRLSITNDSADDVGELVISGSLVARGYCGEDSTEVGAFGTDDRGVRSYATGDLVRRHGDGSLEWESRKDELTKVRGNRVSLSEISAALEDLPEVRNALVVQRTLAKDDEPALVAYVVSALEVQLDFSEIKRMLGTALPSYMLPDRYCQLDEIPLLPSGKLDRSALPTPAPEEPGDRETGGGGAASGSGNGEFDQHLLNTVLYVFRKVLRVDDLSLDGDFFDLGGTSALAAVVAGLLGRTIGRTVEIREVHDFRTARQMTLHLMEERSDVRE